MSKVKDLADSSESEGGSRGGSPKLIHDTVRLRTSREGGGNRQRRYREVGRNQVD
jgi:hypothetical protein